MKLSLSNFLARWNIDCYKDHEGNYYIETNTHSDYFHGRLIKCSSMDEIVNCMPYKLVTDDLNDMVDDLGKRKIAKLESETGMKLNKDDCEYALKFLTKAKELYPNDKEITYHYNIMDGYVNANFVDDISDTNLTIAVIQSMEKGICRVGVSPAQNFVMCQFGDNEFYFNEYASESTSMSEFLGNVCNGSSRDSDYPNDYDEYGENEMARDIADEIEYMSGDYFFSTEALYYLYLMKENLPEFYHDCLNNYISKANELEDEKDMKDIE